MTAPGSPIVDVPAAPPAAAAVFGERLPAAVAFADLLGTVAVTRGLLGPREVAELWPRHLLNSAALRTLVPAGATVVDLGSGAGLPGIPLALARPDLHVRLVEPMARRVRFLTEVRESLDLTVEVVHARAEDLARGSADVVVARAVAPLERLAPMAMPVLRRGGRLLAIKGRTAATEVRRSVAEVRAAGGAAAEVVIVGAGDEAATVVVIERVGSRRPTGARRGAR